MAITDREHDGNSRQQSKYVTLPDGRELTSAKAFDLAKKRAQKEDKRARNRTGRKIRREDRIWLRENANEINQHIRDMSIYERIQFRVELGLMMQDEALTNGMSSTYLIAGKVSRNKLKEKPKSERGKSPNMSALEARLLNQSPIITICVFPESFHGGNYGYDDALSVLIEELNEYCNEGIADKYGNSDVFSVMRLDDEGTWIFEIYGDDFNEGIIHDLPFAHRLYVLDAYGNELDMEDQGRSFKRLGMVRRCG